jgi:triosephosphate isomerase
MVGSVNPDNCEELIRCPHVNGLLIGRSALNAVGYLDILERYTTTLESE